MAGDLYTYQIMDCGDICREYPYRMRYRMTDDALRRSVVRAGVIQPLILAGDKPVIVSGHRRFQAALDAGLEKIPALRMREDQSAGALFLYAILFNWQQPFSELDAAWTIRRALSEFKMDPEAVRGEILPALGLAGDDYFLDEYPRIAALHPDLLESIAGGWLPFRGARILARLTPDDQAAFAQLIAGRAALTSNQLMQAGEWLADLLQPSKLSLRSFVSQKGLEEILAAENRDRRQVADQLCSALRRLRFPAREDRHRRFRGRAAEIAKACPEVSVEAPPAFEAEGYLLKARIRRPESLEKVVAEISRHRKLLNSLFDIML